MTWPLTSMLHFRAVTNQFTLVFNPVCQCGTHEGFTQDLGSVLLWRINYYLPNDNGHAKNEGKGQHIVHQVIFFLWWITSLHHVRYQRVSLGGTRLPTKSLSWTPVSISYKFDLSDTQVLVQNQHSSIQKHNFDWFNFIGESLESTQEHARVEKWCKWSNSTLEIHLNLSRDNKIIFKFKGDYFIFFLS